MSETVKTVITFTELSEFLETRIREKYVLEKLLAENTEIVEISLPKLIASLEEIQTEIESNHRTATKAWRQANKIYADFIRKNPGSNLIQRPGNLPTRPAELQTLKSYIRLFKSIPTDTLKMKLSQLKEIFQISSKVLQESYGTRDYWVSATTGSMLLANYASGGPYIHSGESVISTNATN